MTRPARRFENKRKVVVRARPGIRKTAGVRQCRGATVSSATVKFASATREDDFAGGVKKIDFQGDDV